MIAMETLIQYLHSNKEPSLIFKKIGFLVFRFQRKRIKYCLRYKIVILKPVILCFVSYIIHENNCMCFSLEYAILCSLGFSTQSRLATLLSSLIARRWVGLQTLWWFRLKDLSIGLMLRLFVGPTGVYLLDFFCSGIQFNLLLSPYPCFISLLYLDLYVLSDDALIS